jgi:hypothetical protein
MLVFSRMRLLARKSPLALTWFLIRAALPAHQDGLFKITPITNIMVRQRSICKHSVRPSSQTLRRTLPSIKVRWQIFAVLSNGGSGQQIGKTHTRVRCPTVTPESAVVCSCIKSLFSVCSEAFIHRTCWKFRLFLPGCFPRINLW